MGVITVSWTQSERSTGCCTTRTRYFVVGDGMDPTEAAVVRIHPLPECLEYDSLRFSNWDMGVSVPRDSQRARGHWGWLEVSRLKGKARGKKRFLVTSGFIHALSVAPHILVQNYIS